ncbi:DUF3857 domain-containing protein, partial [Candidatus Babeliales bacterium]|nr:DUF3857 domain-containing protein [Candidatus Babeliales bacterium]
MRNTLFKQMLLFSLFLVSFQSGYTQKAPIKFGKIDIEDLKMTTYEYDTSAVALVLCDFGEFDPDEFEFTRLCRIKILKKEGVSKANVNVRYGGTLILKAKTYNLVNGEIETVRMKREAVFEEKVETYIFGTRFSLPNVKEGSIIEFQYTIRGIPNHWLFQQDIPVKWSELRMEPTQYVTMQKNFSGFEALSIISDTRWVAKDIPAFRSEPYINSSYNYLTKFEFDVKKINYYSYHEDINTSWEEVSENLMESTNFGDKLSANLFLNKVAKMIDTLNLSDIEKGKYAYELVRKQIAWNNSKRLYAYKKLNYVFNTKKSGNCSEINLTLVALLDKIELKAYPVVLSTRDNGILSPLSPSIRKLNYVIASVEINGETYLLDATDRHVPFGVLP